MRDDGNDKKRPKRRETTDVELHATKSSERHEARSGTPNEHRSTSTPRCGVLPGFGAVSAYIGLLDAFPNFVFIPERISQVSRGYLADASQIAPSRSRRPAWAACLASLEPHPTARAW